MVCCERGQPGNQLPKTVFPVRGFVADSPPCPGPGDCPRSAPARSPRGTAVFGAGQGFSLIGRPVPPFRRAGAGWPCPWPRSGSRLRAVGTCCDIADHSGTGAHAAWESGRSRDITCSNGSYRARAKRRSFPANNRAPASVVRSRAGSGALGQRRATAQGCGNGRRRHGPPSRRRRYGAAPGRRRHGSGRRSFRGSISRHFRTIGSLIRTAMPQRFSLCRPRRVYG